MHARTLSPATSLLSALEQSQAQPRPTPVMQPPNHKTHVSVPSSLPGAANTIAAIRQGKLEISDPIPLPQKLLHGPAARGDGPAGHPSFPSFAPTDTWPRRMTPTLFKGHHHQASHAETALDPSTLYNNSNRTSATLTSTLQSMSSLPAAGSVRKGSGLKATFRKMFGGKRIRDSFSTSINEHRNSSGNLISNAGSAKHRTLAKPSLLFEEIIRGRALNSNAPTQSSSIPAPSHNIGVEYIRPRVDTFRRRNSFPNVMLPSQDAQDLGAGYDGSGNGVDHRPFPNSLRKTTHRSLLDSMKRRSRSADDLRDTAELKDKLQAQERRLSDEIKYWRNSVIQDPIPTLTISRTEATGDFQVTRSDSSQTPMPPERTPSKNPQSRPPGVDFSALIKGTGDTSVEQRVTTVEVKLIDLEYAIANLQGYELAQPIGQAKPARRRQASQHSWRQANTRSMNTSRLFPQSSFESSSSSGSNQEKDIGERRSSAANTLRPHPAPASDPLTAVAPHPPRHDAELTRLMSMLSQEQEARRGLESQLKDLQRQINDIRFPCVVRGPPTPGHFSTPTCAGFETPPMFNKRNTILPFRTSSPMPNALRTGTATAREHGGDETDTDDGFSDVYETPAEGRDYGFGGAVTGRSPALVGVM